MVAFDSRLIVLSLRITQALLAILVLAPSAYVSCWWRSYWHTASPSQIDFLLFTSIWTFLALAYLILVPWCFSETRAHHKFALLGVEAVTMVFWFAGFLALAVFLGDRVCFGHVCSAAKAGAVFAAFEWVTFVATSTMAIMHVLRAREEKTEVGKGGPSMSAHRNNV